ncbi:nucleotidyltransferase family protein [Bremerella cremea]|uniref:nucleotidyltransferase family protein n=1 Tax=Bremerella cremea TaxID=1031537 RepID=UPI0031E7DF80
MRRPRSFAIIPACGQSRRMGTDKLTLRWRDSTILQTVVRTWLASEIDHVCIVFTRARYDLQEMLADVNIDKVLVPIAPADMKGTIQVGLDFLQANYRPTRSDRWLVAPADMPTLSATTINQVLHAAAEYPQSIVLPVRQGKHGHPVAIPWKLAAEVAGIPEDEGLNFLWQHHKPQEISVEELGQDANTPDELIKLRKSHNA